MNRIDEAMHACRLCPRMCGADRLHGKIGYCGEKAAIVAARAALHRWEEPCISGTGGSGTVFLSGCTLRCVFCQNREIAAGHSGREISLDRLAEIFLELQEKGAHNINLVTPTHYSVCLAEALKKARANGLTIPVIYNTSGYERPEILREMEPYIDIYMPDFKYIDAETAAKYSHAADYFEVAKAALAEMVHQQPQPIWDENGMLTKGVLVRHLVLPGHTGESIRILQYLHEIYGESIILSIMNQYTPLEGVELPREISRKLTRGEYKRVVNAACRMGITQAYIQEGETAKESFIPPFSGEGL